MKPKTAIRTSVWTAGLLGLLAFSALDHRQAVCREGVPPPDKLYYIVRQGDCLWNLSNRFYETPWVWPRVWRNNAYIANPHWIYPGDMILLAHVPGDRETVSGPEVEEVKGVAPQGSPMATTLGIPRSLADTALLREESVLGSGWVLASKDDREMMAQGDEAYLQLSAASPPPGNGVFQVIRGIREIDHPETGKHLGTLYCMLGSVEVVGNPGAGIARARILDSRDAIKAGDILYTGSPPPQSITSKRAGRQIGGTVVAGLRVSESLTQHDFCFIDKGVLDGVELGDSFWVLEKGRKVRQFGDQGCIRLPDSRVALLVVVHAEKNTSTALVTESQNVFPVGARVQAWTD